MFNLIRILGFAAILICPSGASADSEVYYDCHLVLEAKDVNGGWTLEASPHEKFGPIPASRDTLKGEVSFKNFSGQIEIIVATHQTGKVLIRVQKDGQTVPSSYAYTALFTENIETGMEFNDSEIVRMICRKQ